MIAFIVSKAFCCCSPHWNIFVPVRYFYLSWEAPVCIGWCRGRPRRGRGGGWSCIPPPCRTARPGCTRSPRRTPARPRTRGSRCPPDILRAHSIQRSSVYQSDETLYYSKTNLYIFLTDGSSRHLDGWFIQSVIMESFCMWLLNVWFIRKSKVGDGQGPSDRQCCCVTMTPCTQDPHWSLVTNSTNTSSLMNDAQIFLNKIYWLKSVKFKIHLSL